MLQKVRVVRDGNSWAVRLPKAVLQHSGIKPREAIQLDVKQGRIVIYPASKVIINDKYEVARKDAKKAWDKAFEDIWFEIFGIDE